MTGPLKLIIELNKQPVIDNCVDLFCLQMSLTLNIMFVCLIVIFSFKKVPALVYVYRAKPEDDVLFNTICASQLNALRKTVIQSIYKYILHNTHENVQRNLEIKPHICELVQPYRELLSSVCGTEELYLCRRIATLWLIKRFRSHFNIISCAQFVHVYI